MVQESEDEGDVDDEGTLNWIWTNIKAFATHEYTLKTLEFLGYCLMFGAALALGIAGISEVTSLLQELFHAGAALASTLSYILGGCAILTNGIVFCRALHIALHGQEKDEDKDPEEDATQRDYWMKKMEAITGNWPGYILACILSFLLAASTSLIESSATLKGLRECLSAWNMGGVAHVVSLIAIAIIFPLELIFALNELREFIGLHFNFEPPEWLHTLTWYFGVIAAAVFSITTAMAAAFGVSTLIPIPILNWVIGAIIALGSIIPAFISTFQTVRETIDDRSGFLEGFKTAYRNTTETKKDFCTWTLSVLNGMGEGSAMVANLQQSALLQKLFANATIGPIVAGALLVTVGFAIQGYSFFKRFFREDKAASDAEPTVGSGDVPTPGSGDMPSSNDPPSAAAAASLTPRAIFEQQEQQAQDLAEASGQHATAKSPHRSGNTADAQKPAANAVVHQMAARAVKRDAVIMKKSATAKAPVTHIFDREQKQTKGFTTKRRSSAAATRPMTSQRNQLHRQHRCMGR